MSDSARHTFDQFHKGAVEPALTWLADTAAALATLEGLAGAWLAFMAALALRWGWRRLAAWARGDHLPVRPLAAALLEKLARPELWRPGPVPEEIRAADYSDGECVSVTHNSTRYHLTVVVKGVRYEHDYFNRREWDLLNDAAKKVARSFDARRKHDKEAALAASVAAVRAAGEEKTGPRGLLILDPPVKQAEPDRPKTWTCKGCGRLISELTSTLPPVGMCVDCSPPLIESKKEPPPAPAETKPPKEEVPAAGTCQNCGGLLNPTLGRDWGFGCRACEMKYAGEIGRCSECNGLAHYTNLRNGRCSDHTPREKTEKPPAQTAKEAAKDYLRMIKDHIDKGIPIYANEQFARNLNALSCAEGLDALAKDGLIKLADVLGVSIMGTTWDTLWERVVSHVNAASVPAVPEKPAAEKEPVPPPSPFTPVAPSPPGSPVKRFRFACKKCGAAQIADEGSNCHTNVLCGKCSLHDSLQDKR